MTTLTLQNLIDDGIVAFLDAKRVISDVANPDEIGADYFASDMTTQTITFGPSSPHPKTARVNWIGSCGETTWLWGRANFNNYPPEAVKDCEAIRAFGEQHQVPELMETQWRHNGNLGETVWQMGIVASLICGRLPMYFASTQSGGYGVMLVDGPDFRWGEPRAERIATLLGEAAGTGYVSDWTRALRTYAHLRGLTWSQDGTNQALTLPNGDVVTVELDEVGRLRAVSTRVSGSGPDGLDLRP